MGLVLPLWVLAGFVFAQVIVGLVLVLLRLMGITFEGVNDAIVSTAIAAVSYVLAITLVVGLPWVIKKQRTSAQELGLGSPPTWIDLLLAPTGFVVYIILTAIFSFVAMQFLTFVDYDQTQAVGFAGLNQQYEFVLAFISLVIVAPVAEEVLFRGYLLGKLRKHLPLWGAILVTSLLFAAVHLQWNVAIDVFALSLVLCVLRVISKSLWPSILLHMIKNGIAFYFLFINPLLLTTLGG
ncbi:CPBP family intramembrane metalloprotease [Candidatus Saccharibacteria bacterium]|nr:CPBP family intramembrane metalloprotease [Candidatus Saccharibacteria bacterium]